MSHHKLELHVLPAGRDIWSGQYRSATADGTDGPLASLDGACDALRKTRQSTDSTVSGAIVHVHPGICERTANFCLHSQDSGTRNAPIIYRAVRPSKAVLLGGRQLEGWLRITTLPEGNWQAWQTAGYDQHSLISDPLFVDSMADELELSTASPAWQLGFSAIPYKEIGPQDYERFKEHQA